MNRNFISVILGGWGDATGEVQDIQGEMIAADIDTVATSLNESKNIMKLLDELYIFSDLPIRGEEVQ